LAGAGSSAARGAFRSVQVIRQSVCATLVNRATNSLSVMVAARLIDLPQRERAFV
jgi:hypothetical protein